MLLHKKYINIKEKPIKQHDYAQGWAKYCQKIKCEIANTILLKKKKLKLLTHKLT